MKKKICAIMVATMALSLTACGENAAQTSNVVDVQIEKVGQDDGETVSEKVTVDEETVVNIANPWTSSDKQGVYDATGFSVEAPQGATEIDYSYMADVKMAQLSYVYEGTEWVYRIQPAEKLTDISGMNYEWISDTPGKVSDFEAEYKGYSEQEEESEYIDDMFFVQVVNWYDDKAKVTYSLSASGKNLDGMDIEWYAESIFSSAQ